MTIDCPEAQLFFAEHCAPFLMDKYHNDDRFIIFTSDGRKRFDYQLALLTERDVFSPVVASNNKVVGFFVPGYPEYLLADTDDADSNVETCAQYVMGLISEGKQPYVFQYSGLRDIYALGGNVYVLGGDVAVVK
jgi:hypothetical protein